MIRPNGSQSQDGLTLIELLVSLTILSVILGLLSGALRVISKNWDAHAQQIDALDMMSRAADILHRDASGLQRVVSASDAQNPRYLFTGDPGHLSFIALEPPYPTQAGPYFIDYSIVAGSDGADLVRARAPYEPGMPTLPSASPANRVSLLQGAYQYRFSYAANEKGKLSWYDRWPFDRRLPALIRLDIIDARSGGMAVSPVIVAVRADAEVSCISDQPGPCSAGGEGELKASSSRQDAAKSNAQSKGGATDGL